jgi:hypothetical protein
MGSSESNTADLENMDDEKIIVAENFEVCNGLFGLDQGVYLNLIKFLSSSAVRKVKYFCFVQISIFLVIVHWK